MSEIWKPIAGWPLYEVSSVGRIRRALPGKGTRAGRMMKWQWGTGGYWHVTLSDGEGIQLSIGVNVIVCRTFHGEPPAPGMHAAHRNGDKDDNSSGNLYWATPVENAEDRRRHGRALDGSRNPAAKLTESDIPSLRSLASSSSAAEAAKAFGVSQATVSMILNKKRWRHVS